MNARLAPRDYSYVEQCIASAQHDAANAELIAHMAECPECAESPWGFCPIALRIVPSLPDLKPQLN